MSIVVRTTKTNICDRCKCEFTPEKYNTHVHSMKYKVYQEHEKGEFDFCLKCSDDFYEFMGNNTSLQHYKDSTLGLYCIDRNPKDVTHEWIKENSFQLTDKQQRVKELKDIKPREESMSKYLDMEKLSKVIDSVIEDQIDDPIFCSNSVAIAEIERHRIIITVTEDEDQKVDEINPQYNCEKQ